MKIKHVCRRMVAMVWLMAVAGVPLHALADGIPAIIAIGAEESAGPNGRLSGIATDAKNQPHIACDLGAYCYFYDKINGTWIASSFNSGSLGSSQYYEPHLEIDRSDVIWCSGSLFRGLSGLGFLVRTAASTGPSSPGFTQVNYKPNGGMMGNLSLDLDNNEMVVWGSERYWGTFFYDATRAGLCRETAKGQMYCGTGGEANSLWVSKAGMVAHANGTTRSVWHVATAAHSGYGYSYYQNSIRSAKGLGSIAWADPAYYRGMGVDGCHVNVCSDNKDPEVAYVAVDLSNDAGRGGIVANVINNNTAVRPISGILEVDPAGNTGLRRFSPDMAPAKDGGVFIIWTSGGRIKIRHINSAAIMGPVTDVCAGTRGAICTDAQGNLHIAYINSTVKYRKLLVAATTEWLTHGVDFGNDGADDLAVYDPTNGQWNIRSITNTGVITGTYFGGEKQTAVPADYDGDGWGDLAIFNQTSGIWNAWSPHLATNIITNLAWGVVGAQPVQGDYDGDGHADLALFSSSAWNIWSVAKQTQIVQNVWTLGGTRAVPGDYDGDGSDDLATYDVYTGKWFIRTPDIRLVQGLSWGWPGAAAMHGDCDGDEYDDCAVFDRATGKWYVYSVQKKTALVWGTPWGWKDTVGMLGDYDGDGTADLAVYDTIRYQWYAWSISKAKALVWQNTWGVAGGKPFSGDFNRDGTNDLCVYETSTATWYIKTLQGKVLLNGFAWGWPGATSFVADFDGDRADDIGVYDSATARWYIRSVRKKKTLAWGTVRGFGTPIPDDYDGDGADDLAAFNAKTATWDVYSLVRQTNIAVASSWGAASMVPIGGDYDGDGRADLALFDNSTGRWHIRQLELTLANGVAWGGAGLIPIAGDFDGDMCADLAVYDPPNGRWYIWSLTQGLLAWSQHWGWSKVIPGAGDYDGDGADDLMAFEPSGLWFIYSLKKSTGLIWNQTWGYQGVVPIGSTSK